MPTSLPKNSFVQYSSYSMINNNGKVDKTIKTLEAKVDSKGHVQGKYSEKEGNKKTKKVKVTKANLPKYLGGEADLKIKLVKQVK